MDATTTATHTPLIALSAADTAAVLTPRLCLDALSTAYADLHADPDAKPKSLEFLVEGGGFHLKAALNPGDRDVMVAKLNANFPGNPAKGMTTIQGVLLLSDARDGSPLAVMDSAELTAWRTAAAAALAARYGARPESRVATVIGCGRQAIHQLAALADLLPLDTVHAFDISEERAQVFAAAQSVALDLDVYPAKDLAKATLESDVIVVCTTSYEPVLMRGMVPPGCFVAAVGADNPRKQELDAALFKDAAVLVDDLDSCVKSGDLAHAIRARVVMPSVVRASLAELAAGAASGRLNDEDIVVYDSVGAAVQDVAVAKAAWLAAVERKIGLPLSLA